MSLTPEVTNSSKSRISPCGSGISKNLLTPCRRVGLSRKIKTPRSTVKMGSEDLSSSIKDCAFFDTTPVNHRKSLNNRKSKRLPSHETTPTTVEFESEKESRVKSKKQLEYDENFEANNTQKDLFQSIASENLFNSQKDADIGRSDSQVNIIVGEDDFNSDTKENRNNIKMCLKRSIRRLSSDDLLISNNQIDDSEDEFKINSTKSKSKQRKKDNKFKRIKRTLSKKISVSSMSDEEFLDDKPKRHTEVRECKINIHRLSEEEICLSEYKANISKKNHINTAVIDDDEDAFTSTPEQEKNDKKKLVQQIKLLETQLNKKRQHLANLKQALVYRNKHNVDELQLMTSKWMKGCADGLNGLLNQLQAHGPMNITTLLNNLQIPSEVVAKLPLKFDS